MTTAWGVNAGYEHFWNKRWQTSVYGTYMSRVQRHGQRAACVSEGSLVTGAAATCNNNFAYWNVGTRTQFNVDSQTYIGVDVIYTGLEQEYVGSCMCPVRASSHDPQSDRPERLDGGIPLPSQLLSLIAKSAEAREREGGIKAKFG